MSTLHVLENTLLVSADVCAPHEAAAGLTDYNSVYNSMMHVEAGLLRNEAVFTPHLVAAALEPLRLEHFYFRNRGMLDCQQKFISACLAMMILGAGLLLSSLVFVVEQMYFKCDMYV